MRESFLASAQLLVVCRHLGIPWLERHRSKLPSARGALAGSLSSHDHVLQRTAVTLHSGPTVLQDDLTLTVCLCNNPISTQGHMLRDPGLRPQHIFFFSIYLFGGDTVESITVAFIQSLKEATLTLLQVFCISCPQPPVSYPSLSSS